MFIIRWLLGRIILLIDFITSPKKPQLSAEQKQSIAEQVSHLSLYQLAACPFCVKVRRALKRQGIEMPIVDIKANQGAPREELLKGGGKAKVPCLRIDNGKEGVTWMYESNDIINYLSTTIRS
ncbi:glutaredoxin family protein [Thalassotalea atypica]|uniref:glutaredoxin family protein n=1 Tax=Thalassotalea atypica TaxID=2054316 RepID=UPI0025734635|nr:glutathione S-transferase N-terminal domain-containing protein [Thalassotalea atypica]